MLKSDQITTRIETLKGRIKVLRVERRLAQLREQERNAARRTGRSTESPAERN